MLVMRKLKWRFDLFVRARTLHEERRLTHTSAPLEASTEVSRAAAWEGFDERAEFRAERGADAAHASDFLSG